MEQRGKGADHEMMLSEKDFTTNITRKVHQIFDEKVNAIPVDWSLEFVVEASTT